MRYLGGKSRIAKDLASVIRGGGDGVLVEPFMGGGAMTSALAPHFREVRSYDMHPDLVLMWSALLSGWQPPAVVEEWEYALLKHEPPSPERGFVGFGCSFGGKWFGGFARDRVGTNYAASSARSLGKAVGRNFALLGNVKVAHADYRAVEVPPGAVVYADPPYAGTTGYETGGFDNSEFWHVAEGWAGKGASVYVSEYAAPAKWTPVWEKPFTRGMASADGTKPSVVERLFHMPPYCGY